MTDNIVARLRDTHPNFDEKPMCEEAADEIERLRAELRDVVDAYDWWQVDTYDQRNICLSAQMKQGRSLLCFVPRLQGRKIND